MGGIVDAVMLDELLINEQERNRQAEEYLSRGWAVLPIIPGRKTPASRHGVKDAVTRQDPSGSRNWRLVDGFWLALATGTAVNVLDVDVKGDKKGLEAIAALQQAGVLDKALGSVSTPSGGRHYYFPAHPEEKSRANAPWGLDWQCAGKYVVAPPTPGYRWETWSGTGDYLRWTDVCDVLDIKKPVAREAFDAPHQSPAAVAMDLAGWLQSQTINRNAALYWAACRVAEFPNANDADFDRLKQASLSASEDGEANREDEIARTIQSARESVSKT